MQHKRFTLLKPTNSVRINLTGLKLSAILLLIGLTGLQAQESVNVTGGNASGSGGTVSYSVGQLMYQTLTGTNGSVVEGVQQPYEISVVTGIELTDLYLMITAFPNPTTDHLTLEVNEFDISNLSYQLYDLTGKLLHNEKITARQTSISMSNLMSATYFVKVIQGRREVKTFKIIKK